MNPISNTRIVIATLFIAIGILSLATALKLDYNASFATSDRVRR